MQKEIIEYKNIHYPDKDWLINCQKYFNVKIITSFTEVQDLVNKGACLCSRCSKVKTSKKEAVPKDFYLSTLNLKFYSWCDLYNVDYAILSDKYGIHWFNELLETYDIHPSTLNQEQFLSLSKEIKRKMKERNFNAFIFYNTSPKMSRPYFYMMYLTGLPIYYISKLPVKKINLL